MLIRECHPSHIEPEGLFTRIGRRRMDSLHGRGSHDLLFWLDTERIPPCLVFWVTVAQGLP